MYLHDHSIEDFYANMSAQLTSQLRALHVKLDLVVSTIEAICEALPPRSAEVAVDRLARRMNKVAATTAGTVDEAQLAVLAPVLTALTRARTAAPDA